MEAVFKIRQELPSEYDEFTHLLKRLSPFPTIQTKPRRNILDALRKKDAFIPELSLVAEHESGQIIGHIVLYKTNVAMLEGLFAALLLSPTSVRPDYFRRGVARANCRLAR